MATDVITKDAAHLAIVEEVIGSVAHAAHLPFTGHLLSLNEGAFLCHGCIHSSDRRSGALACYEIAGVAATIKSLAPTNRKLGPMLAILMQGLLFSTGIVLFGRKRIGQFFGMLLLSTWAFIHPFLGLLVAFGPTQLKKVISYYLQKLHLDYHFAGLAVLSAIFVLFALKLGVSLFIVRYLNRENEEKWEEWQTKWTARANLLKPKKKSEHELTPLRGTLRDLRSPLFLLSFALTWIFLLVQKESWSEFVWLALRPLGVAFLFLYLLRSPTILRVFSHASERVGVLKPIHRRLLLVRHYWETRKNL